MEDHARGTVGFTYEVGDLGDKAYNLTIKAGVTGQDPVVIQSQVNVAVENGKANLSVVICKAESLDEPDWKPVSTNDIPVEAATPAGFFIVAP